LTRQISLQTHRLYILIIVLIFFVAIKGGNAEIQRKMLSIYI